MLTEVWRRTKFFQHRRRVYQAFGASLSVPLTSALKIFTTVYFHNGADTSNVYCLMLCKVWRCLRFCFVTVQVSSVGANEFISPLFNTSSNFWSHKSCASFSFFPIQRHDCSSQIWCSCVAQTSFSTYFTIIYSDYFYTHHAHLLCAFRVMWATFIAENLFPHSTTLLHCYTDFWLSQIMEVVSCPCFNIIILESFLSFFPSCLMLWTRFAHRLCSQVLTLFFTSTLRLLWSYTGIELLIAKI